MRAYYISYYTVSLVQMNSEIKYIPFLKWHQFISLHVEVTRWNVNKLWSPNSFFTRVKPHLAQLTLTLSFLSPFFLNELCSRLVWLTHLLSFDTSGNLSGFFAPGKEAALDESIPIRTGALTSEEEIFKSAGHVVIMTPACANHWICPRASHIRVLGPFADVNI